MPLYEYVCQHCGERFEKLVRSATSSPQISVQAVQVRLCSVSFRHLPQMVVTVTVATRRLPVGQLAEVYQVVVKVCHNNP